MQGPGDVTLGRFVIPLGKINPALQKVGGRDSPFLDQGSKPALC